MTTDKAKIIELLSDHAMSESILSRNTGIKLKELRPMLDELYNEKIIGHMCKMVWLKSQEDEYGRVDWSKIEGLKNLIGAAWRQER